MTAVKHAVPARRCYTFCGLRAGSVKYKPKVSLVAPGGVSLLIGAVALAMPRRTRGQVRIFPLPALLSQAGCVATIAIRQTETL